MADFATPSSSKKRKMPSSPKTNNLETSVKSFGKRLCKLRDDAYDIEKPLDERKKCAIYGLNVVFLYTYVALYIKELVSFIRKPRTIVEAEDFTQTQKDIQEISESEGSTSTSASDATPTKNKKARKKRSPKFKTALSAAKNLREVLYDIILGLGSATISEGEKKSMAVNALKMIHTAQIIKIIQDLQHVKKEISEIGGEPDQNSPIEESELYADIAKLDEATYYELLSNL